MEQEQKMLEAEILGRAGTHFRLGWRKKGDDNDYLTPITQAEAMAEAERLRKEMQELIDPRVSVGIDDHGYHWTALIFLSEKLGEESSNDKYIYKLSDESVEVALNSIAPEEIETQCIENVFAAIVKQAAVEVVRSTPDGKEPPRGILATRKVLENVEMTLASCVHCSENVILLQMVARQGRRFLVFMVTDVSGIDIVFEVPYGF